MDRIRIEGGLPLKGRIAISGAKNAALPIMCASLLTDETLRVENLPDLADISTTRRLLQQLGVSANHPAGAPTVIELSAPEIISTEAPYDLVRKMRASVLVLGPLLARAGTARVSLPGGCAIGTRPVDLHLRGLEEMGAKIELAEGYIQARAPQGLKAADIHLSLPSVGATENLMMAASLADGTTVIANAAREPEIADLGRCLTAMGAKVSGAGSDVVEIRGAARLHGAAHRVIPDRIETGTYAIAAAITGGEITLAGVDLELFGATAEKLEEAGISLVATEDGVAVARNRAGVSGVDVMTQPYPGFATDLQAQFMALMTICDGASMITETIFENRFMHVPELMRMGAQITVHGGSALVRGVERLNGAQVMATDLRASVSVVLAGLAAKGETIVNRVYHLDRGYERIEAKLKGCGARIERLP